MESFYKLEFKIILFEIDSNGRERIIDFQVFDNRQDVESYLKSKNNPPMNYPNSESKYYEMH